MVEEIVVPAKNTTWPQVTGNILTCPSQDSNPGSTGERQLAVSGNALDRKGIRAGPTFSSMVSLNVMIKVKKTTMNNCLLEKNYNKS